MLNDDMEDVIVKGDLYEVARNARAMIAPPITALSYRAVASEIKFPDGPKAGQTYDPELDPIHAAMTEVLEADEFTRYVMVGAVQTGKSLILMLIILRAITQLKQSVVYSQPTMPKISEAWTSKMLPIIECSSYKKTLPTRGQGSKGSQTPNFILFREPKTNSRLGIIHMIPGGGKSEAAQAGTTAPWVIPDELDSYRSRHRVELLSKRADSYGKKARRIYTSTVKHDENSIILGMYDESTQSRLHYKCPHCNVYNQLEWENVTYDNTDEVTAMQSVRYTCPACAVLWTESDRSQAHQNWKLLHVGQSIDKDGKILGSVPRNLTFGLLWTGLDSTIRPLSIMALEHYRATKAVENGDHGPMRSFWRDQLCRMYKGELEELEIGGLLTWQKIHQRTLREKWGPYRTISDRDPGAPDSFLYSRHVSEPPSEASHSVISIDVQGNRVYWMMRCFNLDKTSWINAYGYEYSRIDHDNHNEQELHATLDRVAAFAPKYAGQTNLVLGAVDVGDETDMVRKWIDARGTNSIWRAMKGHTTTMKAEETDVEGLAYYRNGIILMQADAARDMFHSTFRRPIDAMGTTHLAYGLGTQDVAIFRHLVSEQSSIDPESKKRIVVRGTGRNDWLDCGKMTEVLIYGFIADHHAYAKTTEKKIESTSNPRPKADPDAPVRVASTIQSTRPRYTPEGNSGGMYRINRRSSRFMR